MRLKETYKMFSPIGNPVTEDIFKNQGKNDWNGRKDLEEKAKNPSKKEENSWNDLGSVEDTLNGKKPKPKPDSDKSVAEKLLEDEQKKEDAKNEAQRKRDAKMDKDNISLSKKYSVFLANWYGINPSFLSGEIRVIGSPDYRVGQILYRQDPGESDFDVANPEQNPAVIEYYIEGVSHEFNFDAGYTTTLRVTRGVKQGMTIDGGGDGSNVAVDRFRYWNDPIKSSNDTNALTREQPGNGGLQLFSGGLFGEMDLGSSMTYAEQNPEDGGGSSGGSSESTIAGSGTDDYPVKWKNATQDSLADDWGYLNRECVSWAAWKLSKDPKNSGFSNMGNAANWGNFGKRVKDPQPGDVVWFANGSWAGVGVCGHVGIVEKVKGNDVIFSDYNFGQPMGQYNTHPISKDIPSGFLRFK